MKNSCVWFVLLFCYSSLCFVLPFFSVLLWFHVLVCFTLHCFLFFALFCFFSCLVFVLMFQFISTNTPDEYLCLQAQRSCAMLKPVRLACVYIKQHTQWKSCGMKNHCVWSAPKTTWLIWITFTMLLWTSWSLTFLVEQTFKGGTKISSFFQNIF